MLVAAASLELFGRGGHQQLVKETTPLPVQPAAQLRQPRRLACVERCVAFGVVANQDLGEGRVEGLDVAREVLAVLELELGLAGSLGRHRQDVATRLRLSRDGGAELLVDEDAGAIARGAATDRLLEAFEDESLRVADAGTHLVGDRRGRRGTGPSRTIRGDRTRAGTAVCRTRGPWTFSCRNRSFGRSLGTVWEIPAIGGHQRVD